MDRNFNPNSLNPFTALPNTLFGKVEGYEWAVLMALRYHGCECYPSHKRISELAGVSIRTVQRTLDSLKSKGFLSWTPRMLEGGHQTSNFYSLHIGDGWGEGVGQTDVPPRQTDVPPTSVWRTPHVCVADEQDSYEQDSRELKEPPISPMGLNLENSDQEIKKEKKIINYAKLDISMLRPGFSRIGNEFIEWWNNYKDGEKTENSYKRQITQLRNIHFHPQVNKDIEALRLVLRKAIEQGKLGKPWKAITLDRWIKYNLESWILYRDSCKVNSSSHVSNSAQVKATLAIVDGKVMEIKG